MVFTRPQCAQTAKMPGLAWTAGRSGYPSIAEPNTSREEQEGLELRYWDVRIEDRGPKGGVVGTTGFGLGEWRGGARLELIRRDGE